MGKAEEFLDAAAAELESGRTTAATSLAIHAGINAADAVCAARLGRRSAALDHQEAVALVRQAGPDGNELANDLERLLRLKPRAEYDVESISVSDARRAVTQSTRCLVVARRVLASRS
jgi:hypothetical protein